MKGSNMTMIHKVTGVQKVSANCLVCGTDNHFGLRVKFLELSNRDLCAIFRGICEHQSYPGRMHGGMISAILDETIGRAVMMSDPDIWGVTVELSVRFLKPVPLNEKLLCVGRITNENKRIFEGTGEVYLENGTVAAAARAKYMKIPLEKLIEDDTFLHNEWKDADMADIPSEVEY